MIVGKLKEIVLLRQLNHSYRCLGLKYSRMAVAFALMVLTALLEMSGLSSLYPLVLALGGHGDALKRTLSSIPSVDRYFATPESRILLLFWAVAAIYTAKNVTLYFTYRNTVSFATYYHRNLIRGLYSAYVRKSLLEFRKDSAGSLAHVICVQSGRLVDGVVRPLLVVITEFLLLIAIAIVVAFISPWLIGIVILTCGGAAVAYYAFFRRRALRWGERRMGAAASLQELVHNTAKGISEIKVFAKEDYLTSRVFAAAAAETDMFLKLEMYQQGPRFVIESVFVMTFVAVFAAFLMAGTAMPVLLAQFSVVAAASFRILPCLNRLLHSYSSFSFNLGPALQLMETIAKARLLVQEQRSAANGVEPHRINAGLIEARGLSFAYPGTKKPVLAGLSCTIARGQRVGVLGPSGAGKSTLIEILAGLHSPTEGKLLVDGRLIAEDARPWQASIAYVPQAPFILPGTVRENVVFGSNGHDEANHGQEDQVRKVLKEVGLSSVVAALPQCLDTEIGEKGAGLSGGQAQLVCLARALYRRPTVLLLDEPTAALDEKNEEVVLQAIRNLTTDTTIVMVSHKRENFRGFDAVYSCADGKLTLLPTAKTQRDLRRSTVPV
jgi:ATP-binding cassette subfamily C protein